MRHLQEITLTVNGRERTLAVEPRRLLVDVLRDDLGLVGTHIGCEHGVCGTCTVLLDGASIRSCSTVSVQADGRSIRTVEGLADGAALHPLQEEFWDKQGLQCGYCTPGMLMRALEILERTPTRLRSGSGRGSPATCAGAPATSTSSRRSWPRPRACGRPS